jgi:hypothetical protein
VFYPTSGLQDHHDHVEVLPVNPVQIGVHPRLANLTPDEEPLRSANEELIADLREISELGVSTDGRPAPGTKGQWSDLVIALGGPSVIAGLIKIFRLWLNLDRRRSLTLIRELGGKQHLKIEITGDTISERTIHDAVHLLLTAEKDR